MNRIQKLKKYLQQKIKTLLINLGLIKNNKHNNTQGIKRYYVSYTQPIKPAKIKPKRLFSNAIVGDVFFCLMPNEPEEILKIEPTHRVRPYIILKKKDNTFLALQGSSKVLKNNIAHRTLGQIQLDGGYYSLEKIYEIPVNNIKNYFATFDEETIEEVYRRLSIRNLYNFEELLEIDKITPTVKLGDVIKRDNKLHYVFKTSGKNAICYPISIYDGSTNQQEIKILDFDYQINLKKSYEIKEVEVKEIIMFVDNSTQRHISEQIFKKIKVNKVNRKNFEVGDVIFIDNLRYVVGDKAGFKQYEIYKTLASGKKRQKYIFRLKGDSSTYCIDLSTPIKTELKKNTVVIDHIDLDSASKQREIRREELLVKKNENRIKEFKKYSFITDPGTIIKDKIEEKYYVYLFDKGSSSFIVNVDDFYDGEYQVDAVNKLSNMFEFTDNILNKEDFNTMLNELIEIKHGDRYILQEIIKGIIPA